MASLHKTRNDLGDNAKQTSVGVLNATLVDTLDLTNAVRVAHWTVKGPQFIALHELFGDFYDALGATADDIAERCVQLGGTPDGTTQAVGASTRLVPYPADVTDGIAHCAALTDRFAALAATVRIAIDTTATAGDADTADLLTGFSRQLDKNLWMLEAHAG